MKKLRKKLESARAGRWSNHRRKPRRQLCILRMSRCFALLLAKQGVWEVTFLRPQANCRAAFCTLQRFPEAPCQTAPLSRKKPATKTIPQNDTPTIPPQWARRLHVGGGPFDTQTVPCSYEETHICGSQPCSRTQQYGADKGRITMGWRARVEGEAGGVDLPRLQRQPKSAESPQAIAKMIAKNTRKKVKKTTTVTKPASRLRRRRRRGGVTSIFGRSLVLSPQAAARVPGV